MATAVVNAIPLHGTRTTVTGAGTGAAVAMLAEVAVVVMVAVVAAVAALAGLAALAAANPNPDIAAIASAMPYVVFLQA